MKRTHPNTRLAKRKLQQLMKVGSVKPYDRPYCVDKRIYTKREAKQTAVHMARTYEMPFDPYRCPVCGQWHVGRSNK